MEGVAWERGSRGRSSGLTAYARREAARRCPGLGELESVIALTPENPNAYRLLDFLAGALAAAAALIALAAFSASSGLSKAM